MIPFVAHAQRRSSHHHCHDGTIADWRPLRAGYEHRINVLRRDPGEKCEPEAATPPAQVPKPSFGCCRAKYART